VRSARLARLFWIGAAALLGVAALIAVVAVVRGEFTETDGKILTVLGTGLVAGGVSLAGLALVERRELAPLGWLAVLGGLVLFAVLGVEVARDWDEEDVVASGYLLLGALLLAATAGLLRRPRGGWSFWPALVLLAVGTAGAEIAIVAEPESDEWAKPLAVVWILAGLAWFLVPVLGRLAGRAPGAAPAERERVVARGPGRHEVELAEGELLIVRRR
jgi:hypothetical protein